MASLNSNSMSNNSGWLAEGISEALLAGSQLGESKLPNLAILGDKQVVTDIIPYAVVPNGCTLQSLEKFVHNDYAPAPHRTKAIVHLTDPRSLIGYVQRFPEKAYSTAIFASRQHSSFTAVLDYHADAAPGWCQHQATCTLTLDPAAAAWMSKNKVDMDQVEMAEFLEANCADLIEPSAASLIEKVSNFRNTSETQFTSVRNNFNGTFEIAYKVEEKSGDYRAQSTVMPSKLTLQFPIFEGMAPSSVEALFRYRIKDGALALRYELVQIDRLKTDAFEQVRGRIEAALPVVPLYMGGFR